MGDITLLLQKTSASNTAKAREDLLDAVYGELRIIARSKMAKERSGHTLQPTVLANDAWLKLFPDGEQPSFEHRAHFFGAAALAMRNILVDHARGRIAEKRGGKLHKTKLSTELLGKIEQKASDELVKAVHEVLDEIAKNDPATVRVVEMRFYLGLTMRQIAKIMGISLSSAERLYREFKKTHKKRFKNLLDH